MTLTPQQVAWLRGLEVAVGGAIGSAVLQTMTAGFPTNKQGWTKFAMIVAGSAYAAARLYVSQSPIQNVLTATKTQETIQDGPVTLSKTTSIESSAPAAELAKPVDNSVAVPS